VVQIWQARSGFYSPCHLVAMGVMGEIWAGRVGQRAPMFLTSYIVETMIGFWLWWSYGLFVSPLFVCMAWRGVCFYGNGCSMILNGVTVGFGHSLWRHLRAKLFSFWILVDFVYGYV
jgi:hypothetical protein